MKSLIYLHIMEEFLRFFRSLYTLIAVKITFVAKMTIVVSFKQPTKIIRPVPASYNRRASGTTTYFWVLGQHRSENTQVPGVFDLYWNAKRLLHDRGALDRNMQYTRRLLVPGLHRKSPVIIVGRSIQMDKLSRVFDSKYHRFGSRCAKLWTR